MQLAAGGEFSGRVPGDGHGMEDNVFMPIKEGPGLDRKTIVNYLEDNGIDTRAVMGGNLSKQPFMKGQKFEIQGDLKNANYITDNSFFIGSHPHINQEARQLVVDVFDKFFSEWELSLL